MYESELKRSTQDRHETPVGVKYNGQHEDATQGSKRYDGSLTDTHTLWDVHRPPADVYEALMQPGEPREEWSDDDWMADVLVVLDLRERAVIDMLVFGQMSLSEVGVILGAEDGRRAYSKQWIAKIRNRAILKLKGRFGEAIVGAFGGHDGSE